MQLIWLFRRMCLFPFRTASNSAYLHCAPSPNAPIFITCILLQRLLASSLVMLSFIPWILLRRFKKEAERKCYLEKILWDKENPNFEKNQQRTLKGPKQELFVAKFFTQFKPVLIKMFRPSIKYPSRETFPLNDRCKSDHAMHTYKSKIYIYSHNTR
jgi:hypothetical protein